LALPAGKSQEGIGIEVLRRLRGLRVDLPYYHNRAGVNIQPKLYYSGANAGLCL
jgi:hypothetical protein